MYPCGTPTGLFSSLSLHQDPHGRQLLMVFITYRLVHIQPGDLYSACELWRDYYRLAVPGPQNQAAGPAPAVAGNQVDCGKEGH